MMKAIVDMSVVLNAWQQKLDFHRQKVKEYELKVSALTEAASMSSNGNGVDEQDHLLLGKTELSLPKSIMKILQTKGGWFSTRELHEELLREGFQSASKNFMLLISNTLQKMSGKGKIEKRKEEGGGNVKYAMPGTLFDTKD